MRGVALIEVGCDRPELNEPVGICTIASFLAQEHELQPSQIKLFWQKLPSKQVKLGELKDVSLFGLSAQINSLSNTESLYNQIRQHFPGATIVIGNLLPIYASDELLARFPEAILCVGEGEVPFSMIYEKVAESNGSVDRFDLGQVPNLMFRKQNELVKTPTMLVEVNRLPPPRRDFVPDLVRIGGITRVESSRGCHWGRCEFCSVASRFGLGGYRRFSAERIVSDLEALAKSGALSPYFSDEDFFGRRYAESEQLAAAVIQAKNEGRIPRGMNFFVSVLSSDVKNAAGEAALLRWKEAGLREVFIGVEAGAEAEIKRFVKKANAGTNTTALSRLLEMGFQVDIGFIMFDPMMTLTDLEQNVDWLLDQPLADIDARVTKTLRIQPKTGLEQKYSSLIEGPLDVDELTYPSAFLDAGVARIERAFRSWETTLKSAVYTLLGSVRGELRDEDQRLQRKRSLACIRDVDLEYLRLLIKVQKGNMSPGSLEREAIRLDRKKRLILHECKVM